MKKDIYVTPVLLGGGMSGGIEPEDIRPSQGGDIHDEEPWGDEEP